MANASLSLSTELETRVEDVARRSSRSASDVVTDALENGHSLAWQEEYLRRVEAGLAAADAGEFASDEDIERVLRKYA